MRLVQVSVPPSKSTVLQLGVVGYDGPVMQIENVLSSSGVAPLQSTVLLTFNEPSLCVLVTSAEAVPPSLGTVADVSPEWVHAVLKPSSVMSYAPGIRLLQVCTRSSGDVKVLQSASSGNDGPAMQ